MTRPLWRDLPYVLIPLAWMIHSAVWLWRHGAYHRLAERIARRWERRP